MVKQIKSLLLWTLMVILLVGFMDMEVLGAEIPVEDEETVEILDAKVERYESDSGIMLMTRFGDATITVSRGDRGMEVCITTVVNGTASIVGVKDIKIKHKVWWGWDTVATSSGGCVYDSEGMSCTLYYAGAIQGDTYKISCVHYADVDGYHELESETTDFIYNF